MQENKLPKTTTLLWQVRTILVSLGLAALLYYFSFHFLFLQIAVIVVVVIGLLIAFLYLPFFFKTYKIILSNDAVIVKYGIFIKVDHIMPYKRMIYAQSFQTPLARLMHISAVRLKAARSYLLVAEIDQDSAQAILDFLAEGEPRE